MPDRDLPSARKIGSHCQEWPARKSAFKGQKKHACMAKDILVHNILTWPFFQNIYNKEVIYPMIMVLLWFFVMSLMPPCCFVTRSFVRKPYVEPSCLRHTDSTCLWDWLAGWLTLPTRPDCLLQMNMGKSRSSVTQWSITSHRPNRFRISNQWSVPKIKYPVWVILFDCGASKQMKSSALRRREQRVRHHKHLMSKWLW